MQSHRSRRRLETRKCSKRPNLLKQQTQEGLPAPSIKQNKNGGGRDHSLLCILQIMLLIDQKGEL